MRKLTHAQRRNLWHVREHGRAVPGTNAGYHCRIKGLTEFLWLFEDETVAATSDQEPREGNWLVKVVGERLTPAGRAALDASDA